MARTHLVRADVNETSVATLRTKRIPLHAMSRVMDRTLVVPVALLALLASSAFSCSSSSSSSSSSTGPVVSVASTQYTLAPGDEKYFCYTTTLAADTVVTGFTPNYGPAAHHILLAQTIAPEPDGFSECTVLFKTTWVPLFVGGKGSTPAKLPDGAGIKLLAGAQVLLQLHLQNAGSANVTGATSVDMQTTDASKPYTPAGIFGIDNRQIDIPAGASNFEAKMDCKATKPMNVFAIFGHMHKTGQHLTLNRGSETIYDADWKFDLQPTTQKTMTVAPDDTLSLHCFYGNNTASDIKYGESSNQEMCAFVLYYTPFDGLNGCVQK